MCCELCGVAKLQHPSTAQALPCSHHFGNMRGVPARIRPCWLGSSLEFRLDHAIKEVRVLQVGNIVDIVCVTTKSASGAYDPGTCISYHRIEIQQS